MQTANQALVALVILDTLVMVFLAVISTNVPQVLILVIAMLHAQTSQAPSHAVVMKVLMATVHCVRRSMNVICYLTHVTEMRRALT